MLVLALKFSRSSETTKGAPKSGRLGSSRWEQTLPENGTERLSKRSGLGLRPNNPSVSPKQTALDDQ